MNTEIRDRIEAALLVAIAEASHDAALGCPVIRTGEVADALMMTLAGILAMSADATGSPTKLRNTVEHVSKRLRSRISALHAAARDAGGFPVHVVDLASVHRGAGGERRH